MALGPGLLESVYEAVLRRALERQGYRLDRQKVIRFEYDEMVFEEGFRTDLLVESVVLVELKSVEKLAPVHSKQLLKYLRLMNLQVGLLINFGAATLKEGLHRIVNNLPPSASPHRSARKTPTSFGFLVFLAVANNSGRSRKMQGFLRTAHLKCVANSSPQPHFPATVAHLHHASAIPICWFTHNAVVANAYYRMCIH
jgi:iron complex transport system substrate-binding protein